MIGSVEKDGFGKKFLFGNYHEIYPSSGWRNIPKERTKDGKIYLDYLQSPPDNLCGRLRVILEQTEPTKYVVCLISTHATYDANQQILNQWRQQFPGYWKGAHFNYDDDPQSALVRSNSPAGILMKQSVAPTIYVSYPT